MIYNNKTNKNQKGSSLISAILVLLVIAIMAIVISQFQKILNDRQLQSNKKFFIHSTKSLLISNLIQDSSWQNTFFASNNFDCLKTSRPCIPTDEKLEILDANKNSVYDSGNPKIGFSLNGQKCIDFGSNPDCVFRYHFRYSLVPGLTKIMIIKIDATLEQSANSKGIIVNPTELNFSVEKNWPLVPINIEYTKDEVASHNVFVDAQNTAYANPAWDGKSGVLLTVSIYAGVSLGAPGPGTPALYVQPTWPPGSTIIIKNYGQIYGNDGTSTPTSTPAGLATKFDYATVFENYGKIWGGNTAPGAAVLGNSKVNWVQYGERSGIIR